MPKPLSITSRTLLNLTLAVPLGVALYALDDPPQTARAYCTICSSGYCRPDYSNLGGYYVCQDDGLGTFCVVWNYCPPLS